MIDDTFYGNPYKMTITGKSLSFIHHGDFIKIQLISPYNHDYNKGIFDKLIDSIEFR